MNKIERDKIEEYVRDIEKNISSPVRTKFSCEKIRVILEIEREKQKKKGRNINEFWNSKRELKRGEKRIMAYQPLYATISDTNSTRHTTSLRSKVEWINFWLNSQFGSVMKVSSDSEGSLQDADTYEAEHKIKEWEEKNNPKRVELWKRKLQERQEYNKEVEKRESVSVEIILEDNPKFTFCINGITIKASDLKLLYEFEKKGFLGKLAVASSFALIPDIKKVIDKEPNALENFKKKKENIVNFLKEEEEKIKV